MQYFILALMIVAAVLVISHAHAQVSLGTTFRTLQFAGGIVISGLALLLAFTGRLILAVPLGTVGLALLLRGMPTFGTRRGSIAGGGPNSSVRTAWLDMSLDHESGKMTGRIVQGALAGRALESLSEDEALRFRAEVDVDPQSAQLVDAFLDRSFAGWRERHGGDAASAGSGGPMKREEAWKILGLEPGASADDIRTAHRELMKKVHPDQGGTTWMATKINAAKDLLLG